MESYIGKVLDDRYEIDSMIGLGGMACVYKARDRRLDRHVAVKILKSEFANDAEFRTRFQNESNAVARLSHKNIVNVFDVSKEDNETEYFVMELIEGITLKDYLLKKDKLNWKQVLFFGGQIAEALEHAHSRGIVHQDIKPQNIMLLRDGTLKVADFGIAKLISEHETKVIKEAIGSVHYISPEQAKGGQIDSRTDIYSLGIVLYEMATGKTPYTGETAVSIVMQHINALPVPPSSLSEMPKSLEEIILKAMSPSVKNRYKTAQEMFLDLEKVKENPNVLFDYSGDSASETKVITEKDIVEIISNPVPEPLEKPTPSKKTDIKKPVKKKKNDYDDDEYEDEDEGSSSFIRYTVTILIVIALVIGAGYVIVTQVFAPAEIILAPDLEERNITEVIDNPIYEEYEIIIETEKYDDAEAGTILKQQPVPESTISKNQTIYLTVSLGPKEEIIPDLEGYDHTQAENRLKQLGFIVEKKFDFSDDVEEDKVISISPEIGESAAAGTIVTLEVSSGRELQLIEMPNLKGLTVDEARAELEENYLILGEVNNAASAEPEGIIFEQSVPHSSEIMQGSTVMITISNGELPDSLKEQLEPEKVRKSFIIDIPEYVDGESQQVVIEVYLEAELVFFDSVTRGGDSFSIDIWGHGTQTAKVYHNSDLVKEQVLIFN